MNRRTFLSGATILSIGLLAGCTGKEQTSTTAGKKTEQAAVQEGYWTCTMHPQVHQSGPGKCPICGMPLVHVSGHEKVERKEPEAIEASNSELQNAQVSRYTVVRKDLETAIPVSGRLLSSREVAFQIYESELSSVKAGFSFTGAPSGSTSQVLNGKINRVDNLVDPSTRTVQALGTLQTPVTNLSAETGFHGVITNTLKNQIVIPEDAVLHTGTRELVYVFASDNKLVPREVLLGQKGTSGYQILSGLKEGEVISSGPNFLIDSEAKLRGQ